MDTANSRFAITHLKGDCLGGLAAAMVAVPVALAFGELSGMGAVAGLWSAIALSVVTACFGGTPARISGPTAPMTVVSAVLIAAQVENFGTLEAAMGTIIAIFLLAGLLQIVLGGLKIGQYVRLMPYPVVSGFISGIGVIIIVLQIFPLLGTATYISPKNIPGILGEMPDMLDGVNYSAIALTAVTIAVIYLSPRVTKAVPGVLVAMIVSTSLSTAMGLDVALIRENQDDFFALKLDTLGAVDWVDISSIFIPALTLAVLGSIDSLLTASVADNMSKIQHDSNRELIGQGLGNIVAAMFGGVPGAGARQRTAISVRAGATGSMSGVVHGAVLVLALLFAGSYIKWIPLPVLAGILISIGLSLIDYKSIRHTPYLPRTEAVIMLMVLLMTVFVDLLQAIAVGMALASILFMKKMSDIAQSQSAMGSVETFAREEAWEDEAGLSENVRKKVYIKHFDGPIFFGFTAVLQAMTRALPDVDVVIMRMHRVPYIDQSGLYAIEDAVMALKEKNVLVLITGLQEQPRDMLERIGLVPDMISEHHIYADFASCIQALETGDAFDNGNKKDGFSWTITEHKSPP